MFYRSRYKNVHLCVMKKIPLVLLPLLILLLCGCPYESPYNLDETALEDIDEGLLGTWTTTCGNLREELDSQSDTVLLIIGKRTDKEYDITITGQLSRLKPYQVVRNDSIKGTAFLSTLAGKRFINSFIHGRVYISELVVKNNVPSIYPLAEYFTSKLIKSTAELRTAVAFHYKVRLNPGYDRQFALRDLKKLD